MTAPDPDDLEGLPPSPEARAENYRELAKLTPQERFKLMFTQKPQPTAKKEGDAIMNPVVKKGQPPIYLTPSTERSNPSPAPKERYTVAVDFDGVLHNYKGDWKVSHIIEGEPIPGAIEWLFLTLQKMDITIFSCRCSTIYGRWAISKWLKKHSGNLFYPSPEGTLGLEDIKIQHTKPKALVYLDDRAMRFEGTFPTVNEIHLAKPWNRK